MTHFLTAPPSDHVLTDMIAVLVRDWLATRSATEIQELAAIIDAGDREVAEDWLADHGGRRAYLGCLRIAEVATK